jgi:hypothetical protein
MERRFNEASASSRAKDRTLQRLKEELEATRHELALVESHLDEVVAQPRPAPEVVLNLSGHHPLICRWPSQSDSAIEGAGRASRGALSPSRWRTRTKRRAIAQLGKPRRPCDLPGRLRQSRRRIDDQKALPSDGTILPAVAKRKSRLPAVGAPGDQPSIK